MTTKTTSDEHPRSRLIIASNNKGKLREFGELLEPFGFEVVSMREAGFTDEIVEDGDTFEENAHIKAKAVFEKLGVPVIADDSGLEIDFLNGAPGVYSARYAPNRDFDKGMEKLLSEMAQSPNKSRKAHFSCVISLAFPDGSYKLFEGRVDGQIALEKHGNGGFGYDPLFVPDGFAKSFAQMSKEEKNSVSHRGRAVEKLKAYLKSL